MDIKTLLALLSGQDIQATLENALDYARQELAYSQTTIQQFNYEKDGDRLPFVDLHQPWVKGGNWGTNTYLKYGKNAAGKTGLYQTTRNVTNAQTDPTVPTNPQSYKFIGWCTT